ncbi:unnamed protein product [Prorocentrum cordatum]|uniref:Uncharacterized protein n=1 Tax=Prorocentrum cordatum TaxID=2364126 RepID=A0ABN9SNQ9_9DINO|nr:unnamed protein product [Polarella glacialis]
MSCEWLQSGLSFGGGDFTGFPLRGVAPGGALAGIGGLAAPPAPAAVTLGGSWPAAMAVAVHGGSIRSGGSPRSICWYSKVIRGVPSDRCLNTAVEGSYTIGSCGCLGLSPRHELRRHLALSCRVEAAGTTIAIQRIPHIVAAPLDNADRGSQSAVGTRRFRSLKTKARAKSGYGDQTCQYLGISVLSVGRLPPALVSCCIPALMVGGRSVSATPRAAAVWQHVVENLKAAGSRAPAEAALGAAVEIFGGPSGWKHDSSGRADNPPAIDGSRPGTPCAACCSRTTRRRGCSPPRRGPSSRSWASRLPARGRPSPSSRSGLPGAGKATSWRTTRASGHCRNSSGCRPGSSACSSTQTLRSLAFATMTPRYGPSPASRATPRCWRPPRPAATCWWKAPARTWSTLAAVCCRA